MLNVFPSAVSCAERLVLANRTVTGENCMFNKVAAGEVKKPLKPSSFIYGDCKLSLGFVFLSRSDRQLIRCRGLEVSGSSHFIYGSFLLAKQRRRSHSLGQVMYLDPTECLTKGGLALPGLSTKWFTVFIRL